MNSNEIISGFTFSFDQGIAENLGIEAAIVYNHIIYWLKINSGKPNAEMIEEKYWMYETIKQMADFFGFLSEDQISRAIKKLVDARLIIRKPLNKNPFDRTSWYTIPNQQLLKKSLRNTENREMQERKSATSDSAISGVSDVANPRHVIYTTEEQTKEKQQHNAAVFFENSNKKETIIYACITHIDIPMDDKIWTCNHYPEEIVKNALEWCIESKDKLIKPLAAALKWACLKKLEAPKNQIDEIHENKTYAMKYDGAKNQYVQVYTLTNCVEISYLGGQKEAFTLEYEAKGFFEQFKNALRKVQIPII